MKGFEKFISQIRKFEISKSDLFWLEQEKVRLMSIIRNRPVQAYKPVVSASRFYRWHYRVVLAGALVIMLFLGPVASKAFASLSILPSSPFYPVKLTAEKLEGMLIFNDAKKLDYLVSLAQKRMDELKQTIDKSGGVADAKIVNKVLGQYSSLMNEAGQNIDKLASAGDKKNLVYIGKKLQNAKSDNVLSQVKKSKENTSAVLNAQDAALETEAKTADALQKLDQEEKDQNKTHSEELISLLDNKMIEIQVLMNQVKSEKGYVVLGEVYAEFEKNQAVLENSRKSYVQGNYADAIEFANEGIKHALEINKTLLSMLGLDLEENLEEEDK